MKKALPTLIGVVALAGLVVGLNRVLAENGSEGDAAGSGPPRPLGVTTVILDGSDQLEVVRTFTGAVVARRRVELLFEGTGRVASIAVDEGDRVAEGDVLARLDTELLRARRAEIEARRARLAATLDELVAGPRVERIDAARAEVRALEQETRIAESLRDRRVALFEKGTISPEDAETARATAATAAARLAAAEARLAELENGTRSETIAAQRGAIAELDAALATLDVEIDRTALRAPFAGTIAARLLDEGAFVSNMMPQAALVLVETGALEVRVGVPFEVGDGIVSGRFEPRLELRGAPLRTGGTRRLPVIDAATRTFTLVLDIVGGAPAYPGDIVQLILTVGQDARGGWVPIESLTASSRGLWTLYALGERDAEGVARVRRVEVEVLRTDGERAFVRGAFDGGLEVVEQGAHRVVPGQRVVVQAAGSTRAVPAGDGALR